MKTKFSFFIIAGIIIIIAIFSAGCGYHPEKSYTTGQTCTCSEKFSSSDSCFDWQKRYCCDDACEQDYSDSSSPCHTKWLQCLKALRCPPLSTGKSLNDLEALNQCGPPPVSPTPKSTFSVWTPTYQTISPKYTFSRETVTYTPTQSRTSQTIMPTQSKSLATSTSSLGKYTTITYGVGYTTGIGGGWGVNTGPGWGSVTSGKGWK